MSDKDIHVTWQNFNNLSPAETERLSILLEECGEVQQVIGKILRHGYDSGHPDGGPTNRECLELELGDVYHAYQRLCVREDINEEAVLERAVVKGIKISQWLHHDN